MKYLILALVFSSLIGCSHPKWLMKHCQVVGDSEIYQCDQRVGEE